MTKRKNPRLKASPRAKTTGFMRPGRRTELTEELVKEISDRVANSATFKAACVLSGVEYRTGMLWMAKGREGLEAKSPTPDVYVSLVHQVESAKERLTTMLKLLVRRAAQGTDKKPGDYRAALALGAIVRPKEFVPQLRVHVTGQFDSALDRLEEALKPYAGAYEAALRAIDGVATEPETDDEETT